MKNALPTLGDLEDEVMRIVWDSGPVAVKDVLVRLARKRAYNTVQTTLDRLYRKSLLRREKHGHAFLYSARLTQADYHRELVSSLVGALLPAERAPVLAAFVDAAAEDDPDNLDELEQLIAAKRERTSR